MPAYNSITIIGNLTRPPEIRYVNEGAKPVTKFSLAVNRKAKSGDEVMYIDVVAWDRLAEICNQYLQKGDPCLISGRLSIRDFTNKDGEKKKAVEIVANEMQLLGAKKQDGEITRAPSGGPQGRSASPATAVTPSAQEDTWDDMGEIPF